MTVLRTLIGAEGVSIARREPARARARAAGARLGLTINWLGISEVVSLNPSNWQL